MVEQKSLAQWYDVLDFNADDLGPNPQNPINVNPGLTF